MKKMWKLNNKAVSPVIATILMVAITVVLAAVLYVMVMGFGGGGSDETPTGSLTYTTTEDGYRITVQSINKNDVLVSKVNWTIDGVIYDEDSETGTNITWAGNKVYVTAGSLLDIELAPGTHTIALLYTETNNNVATITINVP